MGWRDLGTLDQAQRGYRDNAKGKTRLELAMDARPLTRVDEKQFKAEVYARDGRFCRCCGRKVIATIARIPERREVHHIHGRIGDLRFDSRAAIQTCGFCHQRLTGKINDRRLFVIPTQTFTTRQGTFVDARFPIVVKEQPE
jgi:hypothetical protein